MKRYALAFFLVVANARAQEAGPQFVVRTDEGPLTPARLAALGEDWSVGVAGAAPRQVKGGDLICLHRADQLLPPFPATGFLLLTSGDRIPLEAGTPMRLDDERLHFRPGFPFQAGKNIVVPLAYVRFLCLSVPEGAGDPVQFLARFGKTEREHDEILLKGGDRIEGKLLSLEPAGGAVMQVGARKVQVAAGQMALLAVSSEFQARPRAREPYAHVVLAGGARVDFGRLRLDAERKLVTGKALFGAELELPLDAVLALSMRQGRVVYLSDLVPKRYEHTPFLGLAWPLAKDSGVTGAQMSLAGSRFDKGVGMHSRSTVSYELGGEYRWFEALVGIDDQTGKRGRAKVSVLVDGKAHPVAAGKDISAAAPPLALRIDVGKARELTLQVDFADYGDVQAHVNWADARLIK